MLKNLAIGYLDSDTALSPENSEFWFKRFSTSLSIGNGAGVLALASFASSNMDDQQTIEMITTPFALFCVGVVLSGLMPLFLGLRYSIEKPRPPTPEFTGTEKPAPLPYKHAIFHASWHWIVSHFYFALGVASGLSFAISLVFLNILIASPTLEGPRTTEPNPSSFASNTNEPPSIAFAGNAASSLSYVQVQLAGLPIDQELTWDHLLSLDVPILHQPEFRGSNLTVRGAGLVSLAFALDCEAAKRASNALFEYLAQTTNQSALAEIESGRFACVPQEEFERIELHLPSQEPLTESE